MKKIIIKDLYIYKYIKVFIRQILNKISKFPLLNRFRTVLIIKFKKFKYISKILGLNYIQQIKKIVFEDKTIGNLDVFKLDNKKIAVHVHLFYLDLCNEIFQYLKNIHYKYDLYVSINDQVSNKQLKFIEKKINKLKYVQNFEIVKSYNLGKDLVPMFVLFGKKIKSYDFLLHIHTKKSFRNGILNENVKWRRHLFDNLIGSKNIVNKYLSLLNSTKIEIAYPDSLNDFKNTIYFSHLGEINCCQKFYSKINLSFSSNEFLVFPIGNMFWCKPCLFNEIYDNLKTFNDAKDYYSNNETENGIEYVLERISYDLVKKHNSSYAVLNINDRNFYENYNEIFNNPSFFPSFKYVLNTTLSKEIVSFDIFDTLLTRCIENPDDIYELIDKSVCKKFHFVNHQFLISRKRAELNLRKKLKINKDLSLEEIYIEFAKLNKIPSKKAFKIMDIEIKIDSNFIIPRKEMLLLYKILQSNGIKIFLISDMYYSSKIISKFLENSGYYNWDKLFVSSETGLRKDNGTFWNWFRCNFNYSNAVHVGDNIESDYHIPLLASLNCLQIQNGILLANNSFYSSKTKTKNCEEKILKGLIFNKVLFNSPFFFHNKYNIINYFDYGYAILGPILLGYILYLTSLKKSRYYFCSREGYYLKKIFDYIYSKGSHKKPCSKYLLVSRRACSVPNMNSIENIKKTLYYSYSGTLYDFFINRLGIQISQNAKNININLPKDEKIVENAIKPYVKTIMNNARVEKTNYLIYLKNIKFKTTKNSLIIDIGYFGTVQYELSNMLNKKIDAAYISTFKYKDCKPAKLRCKMYTYLNSYLRQNIDFFNYSFLLESFLTAPKGQLIKFDKNGHPIYKDLSEVELKTVENNKLIYNGIINFIDDLNKYTQKSIFKLNINPSILLEIFLGFGKYSLLKKHDNILEDLYFEDLYCANKITKLSKI